MRGPVRSFWNVISTICASHSGHKKALPGFYLLELSKKGVMTACRVTLTASCECEHPENGTVELLTHYVGAPPNCRAVFVTRASLSHVMPWNVCTAPHVPILFTSPSFSRSHCSSSPIYGFPDNQTPAIITACLEWKSKWRPPKASPTITGQTQPPLSGLG